MIVDQIRNASMYYELGPGIEAALRYLESTDFTVIEPGKYDISGGSYALVQSYVAKSGEGRLWEAHRNYIDVQFMASGRELIGYADIRSLQMDEEYEESKDVAMLTGEGSFVAMQTGTFMILFPDDAHMPCVELTPSEEIRKVVVKVPV